MQASNLSENGHEWGKANNASEQTYLYQGMPFFRLPDNPMYCINEQGQVLSLYHGKEKLLSCSIMHGYPTYTLILGGAKPYRRQVKKAMVVYAASRKVSLASLRGKYFFRDEHGNFVDGTREAFYQMQGKLNRKKPLRNASDRVQEMINNLMMQDRYYREGDIQPTLEYLQSIRQRLIAYSLSLTSTNRYPRGEELADEAIRLFTYLVCERKVAVADIKGYVKGIIRQIWRKRKNISRLLRPREENDFMGLYEGSL